MSLSSLSTHLMIATAHAGKTDEAALFLWRETPASPPLFVAIAEALLERGQELAEQFDGASLLPPEHLLRALRAELNKGADGLPPPGQPRVEIASPLSEEGGQVLSTAEETVSSVSAGPGLTTDSPKGEQSGQRVDQASPSLHCAHGNLSFACPDCAGLSLGTPGYMTPEQSPDDLCVCRHKRREHLALNLGCVGCNCRSFHLHPDELDYDPWIDEPPDDEFNRAMERAEKLLPVLSDDDVLAQAVSFAAGNGAVDEAPLARKTIPSDEKPAPSDPCGEPCLVCGDPVPEGHAALWSEAGPIHQACEGGPVPPWPPAEPELPAAHPLAAPLEVERNVKPTNVWQVTNKGDQRCRRLADRHYTRRKSSVGKRQFTRPGRNLVLYAEHEGRAAVWVSWRGIQDHAWPGSWECTIFRNETSLLSSDLIAQAVALTVEAWGPLPPEGIITFVDPVKTSRGRSDDSEPGACYRHAGWSEIGSTAGGHGRAPTIVLRLQQAEPAGAGASPTDPTPAPAGEAPKRRIDPEKVAVWFKDEPTTEEDW